MEYFAAKAPDELAPDLMTRIEDYYQFLRSTGFGDRIRRSYQSYYGLSDKGFYSTAINSGGDRGEISQIKVNQYRSIILGLLNLTTSQKAAFEVRASNTDFRSQTQAILAQGILDYYLREKNLERTLREAVELSLVMGEGYVAATWEPTGGEQYGVNPETGGVIYEGDIAYETFHPVNVIKDVKVQSSKDPSWMMLRRFRNKFDLAAKHSELADEILALTHSGAMQEGQVSQSFMVSQKETDEVPTYEFYHRRSDVLPNGRHVILCDSETVLFDGPLPYRNIPVYRIAAAELHGTPFGYSPVFDLLGVQEIYDILHSTIATNQGTHGVGNVWTKPGSGLTLNQLQSGMNHWESEEEPKGISLCTTPREIFDYEIRCEKLFETLSGMNSTVRGNPSTELHSGAALALVASQAVQFNSGLQQAWANLLEDVGTATFEILQDFAKVPRIAVIVGKHNRSYMKQFSSDDIMKVSRVVVDLGNPIMRTTAGRVEIANQLLQAQKLQTPQEYLSVVKTGTLEALTEADQTQVLNIRAENEDLRDGKPAVTLKTDNHVMHIQEHLTVLDDPDSRKDPSVVQPTTEHVAEHNYWWWFITTNEPSTLQIRNIPPFQGPPPPVPPSLQGKVPDQPPPMPGPPPGAGGPPPGPPGPPPPGQPPHGVSPAPLGQHGAQPVMPKGPHMPSMPKGAPPQLQEAYGQVKQNAPAPPAAPGVA